MNAELFKMAQDAVRSLYPPTTDTNVVRDIKERESKEAFVPADQLMGGAGAMPPPGAPPGGAPAAPPEAIGALPPEAMGAMPPDAMAAAGAPLPAAPIPEAAGAPPAGTPVMLSLDDLRTVMMEAVQMAQMSPPPGEGTAGPPAGGESGEGKGKADLEQRVAQLEELLMGAMSAAGGAGAPGMPAPAPTPAPVAPPGAPMGAPMAAPPAPSPGAMDMKMAAEQHPELVNLISAINVLNAAGGNNEGASVGGS